MKKSSSENFLGNNCFNAKPPLRTSQGAAVSDLRLDFRMTRPRSSEHDTASRGGQRPGSFPTSPTESSPFR